MAFDIANIAQQYNKPIVGYSTTVASLTNVPNFLRTVSTVNELSEATIDFLYSTQLNNKVCVLYSQETYGKILQHFHIVQGLK